MSEFFCFVSLIICLFSVVTVPSYGSKLNCDFLNGGIIAVAITAFDDDGNLNLAAVPQMAKYYADNNITNILITEFNGDGTLPLRERKALVKAWTKYGRSFNLKIIVEIGLLPFVDTLILARYCSELNVAALTHFPELVYQAENIGELVQDLRRISEEAPTIPLIHNELLLINSDVSADAVFLAGDQVPSFCGVETTINTYLDIEAVTSKGDKEVWIFDVHYIYAALLLGLRSVSIGPNIAPRLVLEIEAAAKRCDRQKARAVQRKLNKLIAAFGNLNGGIIDDEDSRTFFANLRAAFELITGIKVGTRVPIDRTNSTEYRQIASNLRALKVPLANSGSQ